MKVTTNNQPRPLFSVSELPEKIAAQFDYIKGDDCFSNRIFMYKGEYHDSNDMMRCPGSEAPKETRDNFRGWHAYASDSYFSGIVIRYADDYESVIVGRYCC